MNKNLDQIVEMKIPDWTGETKDEEKVAKMQFALDKKNVLYMSTPGSLHAITLNDLRTDDGQSLNAEESANLGSSDLLTFGPMTKRGCIEFESDYHLHLMYDTA